MCQRFRIQESHHDPDDGRRTQDDVNLVRNPVPAISRARYFLVTWIEHDTDALPSLRQLVAVSIHGPHGDSECEQDQERLQREFPEMGRMESLHAIGQRRIVGVRLVRQLCDRLGLRGHVTAPLRELRGADTARELAAGGKRWLLPRSLKTNSLLLFKAPLPVAVRDGLGFHLLGP